MLRNFLINCVKNWVISCLVPLTNIGNLLENDYWTPPHPINFLHGAKMEDIVITDNVAAASCPLVCPNCGAQPLACASRSTRDSLSNS